MTASRLGFWSAAIVLAVGVAYVIVLGAGMARHGLSEPIVDPVLAVMEILTLISALPIVVLMAVIYERASTDRRVYGLVALAFAVLFAGTTSAVHFVQLTAVRQSGGGGIGWPSEVYALELLAWDVFLGLALVFAAPVFEKGDRDRTICRGLFLCGVLCLVGTIGPAVGQMRLQLIGVFGYAVVLPVVAYLLMRLFGREMATDERAAG
jgi:hypothetical protein